MDPRPHRRASNLSTATSRLASVLAPIALAGALAPVACRDEGEAGPPPITDVAGAIEVQEDLFEYQCECFAAFDDFTEEECLTEPLFTFSDAEVACLTEVFEGDDESFEALRCEAEALRGLLGCAQARGCPGAFDCGDGQAIADTWICDGYEDCADGRDEDQGCEVFTCSDGEEISPSWVCDDYPDCLDGSDESGCPPPFTCSDGQQVPPSWVCDDDVDCPDGDDEDQDCPETCERPWSLRLARCPVLGEEIDLQVSACLEFICLDGTVLEPSRRCDGTPDCAEGEDESVCDEGTGG